MKEESSWGFSSSHLVLKPEEVGVVDLVKILWSRKVGDSKFVEYCPARGDEDDVADLGGFRRRWMILMSVVAQKVMLTTATPMAWVGWCIEMFLNLVSSNSNLPRLLLHLFQGKVVKPDETSEKFVSFIGNMDKRVKLDESIKYGDPKYYSALCIMASKASYENNAYIQSIVTNHWKMECVGVYDFWNDYQEKASTQAFVMRDKGEDHDVMVVAFRGTEPFNAQDWCSDFDISWFGISGVGKVHGGFMKALGLRKTLGWPKEESSEEEKRDVAYYAIRALLKEHLSRSDKAKFVVTGHSLGGALAILFPAMLVLHGEGFLLDRLEGVYTFGQPRVGDASFGEFMGRELTHRNVRYLRFVYGNDMVPRLPYDDKDLMFKHFGTCVYFDRHYHAKVVEEEPNKNYFSPLGAVPMMMNAFMELMRSFTIWRKMGPEFKEGSFMRIFRMVGLVMPGLSAHSTRDYVNATRLASNQPFLLPQQIHLSQNV